MTNIFYLVKNFEYETLLTVIVHLSGRIRNLQQEMKIQTSY